MTWLSALTTILSVLMRRLSMLTTQLGAPSTRLGIHVTSLGAPRKTGKKPGRNNIFFGNSADVPGNYCYYLLFNEFLELMYSVCFLINVSMSLCMYIAIHHQTVNVDRLQAVLESNSS